MRNYGTFGAILSGAMLAASSPACAEESGARDIVVTATKKAGGEELQQVPAAITAFDADMLAARKVRDLQGLSQAAPGVSLDQIGTFRGVANFAIRGLGVNSSIATVDPAVGTFVDGVYLGINAGVVFDMFDVSSIELLRGPQGVLFGRNTTGGAVLVNTADPSREWGGRARLSAEGPVDGGRGKFGWTGEAMITGPLGDAAAFRLAAMHNSDPGYFRNRFNGQPLGKAQTTALRGALLLEPAEKLRVVAKLEWFETDGHGAITQSHGLFSRDGFDLSLDNPGLIDAQSWFATLRADYELPNGAITAISGWRKYRQRSDNDIDSTPSFLFHSKTVLEQEQFSQELRYAGTHGALELTAGGYWFHQSLAYDEDRTIPPGAMQYGGGRIGHDVYGLFASGDLALAPTLTLNMGLRWSREDKDAAITFIRPRAACSPIAGTCPVTGTNPLFAGEPNGFTDARGFSSWSPKLGVTWKPADTVLAYAHWSRGNRSGGYNIRIAAPAAFLALAASSGSPAYGDERVDSYELGLKLRSSDGKGTLNLAAYRTDVDSMQREIIQAHPTAGTAQSIFNTADARVHGFEVEGRYALSDALELSMGLAHIDAKYRRIFFDISGNGTVGAEDFALEVPRAPRWSWNVGLSHRLDLGSGGKLLTRIDFRHRSKLALTDNNFGFNFAADFLDANLTWQTPVAGLSVSLFGRNLLDEVQFAFATPVGFGAGPFSDGNNRPFDPRPAAGTFAPIMRGRVLGFEVDMRF